MHDQEGEDVPVNTDKLVTSMLYPPPTIHLPRVSSRPPVASVAHRLPTTTSSLAVARD